MKKTDFRRGLSALLSVVLFFTLLFSDMGYSGSTANAASSDTAYLYKNGSAYYDNWSTGKYYVELNGETTFAYCMNPAKSSPSDGYYTVDYTFNDYDEGIIKRVRLAMYYLYGAPGFTDSNYGLQNMVTEWYDGTAMTTDRYIALTHVVCAYFLGSFDDATYGCTDALKTWFKSWAAYITYNLHANEVPDSFQIFVLHTGSSSQDIMGWTNTQEEYYGYIEITKTSTAASTYSLQGAEYGVYSDSSCETRVTTVTIGSNGIGLSEALSLGTSTSGTFYVKEISAPEGYMKSDTVKSVTVTKDNTSSVPAEVTMSETPIKADITVNKTDAETGEITAQGGADLDGAEYTIYNNSGHAIYYKGTIADGDPVITITIENGTATAGSLPYGDYIVRETKAPVGYNLDTAEYAVSITENDGDKTVSVDDEVKRGGVEAAKVDADSLKAEVQGDAGDLSGAAFTIYNASTNDVLVNGVTYAAGTSKSNNGVLSKNASNVVYMADTTAKTYYLGASIMTVTTGSDGTVSIDTSALPYGTYVVKETVAPTGYLLSDTYYVFTIREDGEVEEITVDDEIKRGGVEIYKYDNETTTKQGDASLQGAEFAIINDSKHAVYVDTDGDGTMEKYAVGDTITTIITDEYGYASTSSDLLPYGSYIIKETTAPTGYLGTGVTERSFTIREDGMIVDMTDTSKSIRNNVKRGGITIYKMDEDLVDITGADDALGIAQGDATLAGATYAIVNKSKSAVLVNNVLYDPGDVVMYITTDADGMATTDTDGDGVDYTLPYGTYDIYETEETDEGYLLNTDDVNTVEIREDGVVEVLDGGEVVDTVKRQAFQIVKISADTNAAEVYGVEGAEFTIYNVSDSVVTLNGNVYQTGTETSNNGTSTVNGTTYHLGDAVETITTDSTGYACSSRLSYGTYVVRETKTPTDLNTVEDFVVVIREDSTEPQTWRYFNDSPFTAYIKAIKEDSKTGQTVLIEGVSFKIINSDTGEYVTQKVGEDYIDTFYTKESGYTVTPLKLACGNYELVEITAPYGYTVKDESIKFTVSTNTMYRVDPDNDAVITVECVNDEVTGSVTVYKYGEALTGITTDADGNIDFTYENEPLAGSTFILVADEDIYTPDMQVDEYGVRTIATYNGVECYQGAVVATFTSESDGYVTVEGLPLGSYHIEEIGVTSGYTLSTCVESFTLTYKDQNTAVIYYGDVTYENIRVTTELSLVKTGLKSGEVIEGATYGLYATEDIVSYFGDVLAAKGTLIETRTTDENGEINWTADLPLGQYYVQEIEAAEGTLYNDETCYVDLSYQGALVPVVMENIGAVDDETELDVLKLDAETGEEIEDAVLQLLDENGDVVDEWTTDGTAHKIYRLAPGYYTIHEVSAPAGYVTFSDVTVKVLLTSEVQEVRVADKQTELHVSKLDATNSEELPGAALQIIDASGEVLYEWTSTDEEYVIKKILVGTYTLHEDYTPLGYATAQDIEFTLLDTGDIQSVEMVDEIITVSISKADATTGEELAGAELTLYDAQGEIVDQWTSTDEAHVITGLYVGETYTLHEDLAPIGYATAADVTFTIADTGEVQEAVMYDEIITVSISKKDATTGAELPGAELTLYDSEGNIIDHWISAEEAHIITGLHAGETYTLHEDLAPIGYATASDVTFTVSDTGEIQEVEMFDEPLPEEVPTPSTGDLSRMGISAVMLAGLIMIGAGVYGKKRR